MNFVFPAEDADDGAMEALAAAQRPADLARICELEGRLAEAEALARRQSRDLSNQADRIAEFAAVVSDMVEAELSSARSALDRWRTIAIGLVHALAHARGET